MDKVGRVAIFAQFDPNAVGGIQSNGLSLIQSLNGAAAASDVAVIGLRGYSEQLKHLAPRLEVLDWPYHQHPIRAALDCTPGDGYIQKRLRAIAVYWRKRALDRSMDAELRSRGIEVIHFPYQQYYDSNLPSIYEPWDLQHRHLPEFFSQSDRAWRDELYRRGCQRARFVVTATPWTKQDVCESYGIDPNRVAVIERGSTLFEKLLLTDAPGDRPNLLPSSTPFFIYPAAMHPHKNHGRLLRGFARFLGKNDIKRRLVLTGRMSASSSIDFHKLIGDLGLGDRVTHLGPVPETELIWLLRNAELLVFPSLFEGLGLPLLEALAAGLPVAAGNVTCVADLLGGMGLMFDPTDVDEIAAALKEGVVNRAPLQIRVKRDREILERYCWKNALCRFRVVYAAAGGAELRGPDLELLEDMCK